MRLLYILATVLAVFFANGCGQSHNHQNNKEHTHEKSEESTSSDSENTHSHGEEAHAQDDEEHSHGEETQSQGETHNHESEDSHEKDVENKYQKNEAEDSHQHEEENGHSHSDQENEVSNERTSEQHSHSGESSHSKYHVEEIQPTSFNEVVKTSGKIKALPKSQTMLVAPVAGIVQFENNSVLPGKNVSQGERLFRITSKSVVEDNLKVKYERAKAKFTQAKEDFERAKKLRTGQIISEKEFMQHKTEYLEAKAHYQSIKSHVDGNSGSILSGRSGFIDEVFVQEGDYVKSGQQLARVINNHRLMLKAEISQKYAARLDEFTSANFETSDGKIFNTKDLNGELLSLGKSTTRESFYLPVYYAIDNKENYAPGSFVHVYLIGKTRENVLALPKDAFIENQGNFFVYVKENGAFQKTAVEVGADDGKKMIVKKGLKAGDKVAMHNAYQLKMEQAGSSLPAHGHSH